MKIANFRHAVHESGCPSSCVQYSFTARTARCFRVTVKSVRSYPRDAERVPYVVKTLKPETALRLPYLESKAYFTKGETRPSGVKALASQVVDIAQIRTLKCRADGVPRRVYSDGTIAYFVRTSARVASVSNCVFSVAGRHPELWNPVTGKSSHAASQPTADGKTRVTMPLDPIGSAFVVFPAESHPAIGAGTGVGSGQWAGIPRIVVPAVSRGHHGCRSRRFQ